MRSINFLATIIFIAVISTGCITGRMQLPSEEIDEWSSPESGPNQLGETCGLVYQVSLRRSAAADYVVFFSRNTTKETVFFKPKDGKLEFGDGKERTPNVYAQEITIPAGQKGVFFVSFPEKSDFIGQTGLTVEIPFHTQSKMEGCAISAHFNKDPKKPEGEATISDRSDFLFDLSLGSNLLKTGGASKITSGKPLAVGLSVAAYSKHDGFFFDFTIEPGKANTSVVAPPAGVAAGTALELDSGIIAMGYSYRTYLSHRWTMNFDFGPGVFISNVNVAGQSSGNSVQAVSFGLEQRVGAYYLFPRSVAGQFGLGLTLYNLINTAGKLSGASSSGDSAGFLVNIKFGL